MSASATDMDPLLETAAALLNRGISKSATARRLIAELDGRRLAVYAAHATAAEQPGPLHYMELLAWHVQPPTAASV